MENWIKQLLIFTSLNLLYVIFGVFKDICRQRGTKQQSAWLATLTYGIYILVIKKITNTNTEIAVIGTMLSNFVGDIIGRNVIEHFLPRGIICYRFTIPKEREDVDDIIDYLEKENLGYKWENAHSKHNEYLSFQIYTKDKKEDKKVENTLKMHQINKYNKMETKNIIVK